MNQTAIIPGSIGAIAQRANQSIAETFVNADCIVIVDTSGSMDSHDGRNGATRYETACTELAGLQNSLPGKIAVLAFSDQVMFCPSGQPFQYHGGTNLAGALKFARIADVPGMKFILISDGQPDNPEEALKIAKTFKNKISVIYVGPEVSATGRDFLQELAKATGGSTVTASCAVNLLDKAKTLLLSA